MPTRKNTNIPGAKQVDLNVNIDVKAIAQALTNNPAFIVAISKAVRNQLLRDARQFGTLFRQWGGK